MKHIIEKHVTKHTVCKLFETPKVINHVDQDDFPALISDIEEEIGKFIHWLAENEYDYIGITWYKQGRVTNYCVADLLKKYEDDTRGTI